MVSNIPVAGTFSINTNEDSKDRILFTLQVAVKQIQHCYSLQSEGDDLTVEVREVKQLCESIDKALFHGLKCYDKGYWCFVKEFTHSCTTDFLRKLKNAQSDVQRGRAWLSLALKEATLESYFRSFSQNGKLLKKHYKSPALLCDDQRMQLILMLMAGLEYVPIDLDVKKIMFGSGLSFFDGFTSLRSYSYPSSQESLPPANTIAVLDSELLPCDNAAEVTSDFSGADKSPSSDHEFSSSSELHKLSLNESDRTKSITTPPEEFEMISHYINLETNSEAKEGEEIEVVRTKVVRRVKKSKLDSPTCPDLSTSESKIQSSGDSSSSLENRLSKATMDSGLCLETPCSSENDFSDDTKSLDNHQMSFHVEELQQDINVTFSTPKKSNMPDMPCAVSSDCKTSEERGVPEGQEDPVDETCNYDNSPNRMPLLLGDDGKDSNEELEEEEEEEEISIYDMHKISPIKHCDSLSFELENADKLSLHKSGMHQEAYYKISKDVDIVQEEMAKIALEAPEPLNLNVTNNILLYFLVEVYENEEEEFYKLYPGYSNFSEGFSQRVYFLLSNKSAYIIQPGNDVQKFFKCSSLRYCDINYINVDMNYQGFKLISRDKEAFPLHTADAELTRDILSNLELGIRRFIPKLPLPSVYTNAEIQTYLLSKFLASQLECHLSKIVIHHYVLARWEDYTSSCVTPSGPIYQDYLMYRHKFVKENKATPWKPAFFLLKGGVLYCMESEKSKPLFFIQMCAPHCRGCRRIHLINRPHSFEVIRSNSDSLQLAASDTLEASKWLQFFLESVSLAGHFIDTERNIQRPACVILVNDKIVITVENTRKGSFNLLAKGNICDLVTVFIDHVTPNFLMLEFEIAEASKSCGEWLIYFESLEEKDKFLDVINKRWFELHQVPLSIEPLKDLYLLKRYRLVAEELSIEKLALQDFCADEQ